MGVLVPSVAVIASVAGEGFLTLGGGAGDGQRAATYRRREPRACKVVGAERVAQLAIGVGEELAEVKRGGRQSLALFGAQFELCIGRGCGRRVIVAGDGKREGFARG